ncbi:MAG: transglutaminase [Halioglobus sp.]|nr:transglutaminase [Halioglobus sp.]
MNRQEQIPRNALVWIIICLFTLVAPHALRLPIWVLVVFVIAALWRILVHRGRWSFPGRWVKVALTISCFGGIYASYGSLIGLEPTVALLLTAFALKLIELVQRKDAYVLLFLGYFVCVTEFLFSQDLLITLYSVLNVLLVTTALVALHRPGEDRFNRGALRLASVMLLQALPLMIVLFFLFPRVGPLWTVPIKSQAGKTGMSDFMRPGDVARLSQSDEVAFRVRFDGDIPPQSELYWRGLVFSQLKQGTWTTLGYYQVPADQQRPADVAVQGQPLSYSVIMEPSRQNWLYGLHYAHSSHAGVMHTADFRLHSPMPLETEFMYSAMSWPGTPAETELSDWRRKTETTLPPKGDMRTRELARSLREDAGSDAAFVDAVLRRFHEQEYRYTLQPGTLPERDGMDHFIFESRRGFCEHYAYAFVLMMRAAGVPARVVAGYQGGEINPVNRTVIVHQFDAHAWAEVWLAGQGWTRVDPTAAVAPERIERGLEQAMQSEGSFLADSPLSPLRYRGVPWVNLLRLRYDALTYRWQSWVVGFDNERQFELLHEVFGEISSRVFATVFLGSWALVLVPVAISLLRRRDTRAPNPLDKHYLLFCERLAGLGVERQKGESPGAFARRAAVALPAYASQLRHITALYNSLAYAPAKGGGEGARDAVGEFARAVEQFRPNRRRPSGPEMAIS